MITASSTATSAVKVGASVAASAGFLGLGIWAWVFAIIGAFFAVYLEDAKEPKKAVYTLISILATGFAAALLALLAPYILWLGIGETAAKIPVEARAGLLGLSIRWIAGKVKEAASAKAKVWGEK